VPDDEPGEPTWIDLDAPEPRSTRSASSASRRGWSFSLIAVVAVLGIVAAALLWPDGERADEEVSLGDESGVREHSLVALTDAGDLVELSSATGEQTAVIVESVVPDASRMSVSVTPDGATAYVGRSTSEIPDDGDVGAPRIVAVDTRSGEVTPVTVGAQPAVSPDGRWLALVQPLDPASVEVLDLDDSEAPPIAIPVEGPSPDVPTVVEGIAWSLDSRQLYIASAGRTHVGIDLVEASSGTRTAGWSWAGEGRAAPASFLDDDTVALVDPRGGAEARVVALEVTPVADESPSPTTVPPTTVPPTSVPPTSVPPTGVPSTTVPGEGPPSPAAVPVPGAPTSTFPVGTVEAPPEPPVLRELFDVDGRIDGLTSPPEGGQLAVVMTSGEAATSSRLLRWTEDEGLVELAEGVVAASWGPEVTPEPEPAPPPAPEDDAGTVYAVALDGDLVELSGETGEERRVVAERLLDTSIRAGDAESRWSVDLSPSPDGRTLYVSDTYTEPNVRPVIEAVDLVKGERRDVGEGSGAVV
jgi:dipeptidyl aminopeptidase/acylaminoacyl peptidase